MDPIVFMPGEGERIGSQPTLTVMKATSETTGGAFSLSEATIPPGFPGPPPHTHKELTDSFYVLEGTLTVRLNDDTIEAPPGTYVLVPPGVVHTFSNPGDARVRILNLNSPAGWENYLKDIMKLFAGGGAPDPDEWKTVMARHDSYPAT